MPLSEKQTRLYRLTAGNLRKTLQAFGFSPKDADAERYKIHARIRAPHSSRDKGWNNTHLTNFLAECWAWDLPKDKNMVEHLTGQVALRYLWKCEEVLRLCDEIAPGEYPEAKRKPVIEATWKRMNARSVRHSAIGTEDEWHPVLIAMVYRYDQVTRARLGDKRTERGVRYHVANHKQNLALVRKRFPEPEVPADRIPF